MKFNLRRSKISTKIVNYEGAPAFVLTAPLELYTAVTTASLNDQYYADTNDRIARLRALIAKNDPSFVAKLSLYAREQMHLRSVPLVLAVELARQYNGNSLVGKLTAKLIQRADEITELLAYYEQANERKAAKKLNRLSKQLQKGLGEAFNRFDEYQFAKYDRETAVTLKDALFLVHPKAKDEAQQDLFDKIAKDQLKVPYTWETELSFLGQQKFETVKLKQAAVKGKWEELILSNKMGYMATLRNLRNILEADVSNEAWNKVCEYLGNAKAVTSSRQLPFRFLSAYRELKNLQKGRVSQVLEALEKAVSMSAANIAGFDEETRVVVAADVSGSMQKTISAKSKVQFYDIGLMLAMLLQSRSKNVISGIFGNTWKVINVPRTNILANVEEFHRREGEVGYSTNGYLVVKDLLDRNQIVDKIMIFTDMQLWNSNDTGESIAGLWKKYKSKAPQAKLYLFDLAGYGQSPLNLLQDDVYLIAGWSDKVFNVLYALEQGSDAVELINQIAL
jgi:60 kDa SS-A/Ro ribonucleoprotein